MMAHHIFKLIRVSFPVRMRNQKHARVAVKYCYSLPQQFLAYQTMARFVSGKNDCSNISVCDILNCIRATAFDI